MWDENYMKDYLTAWALYSRCQQSLCVIHCNKSKSFLMEQK